MPLPWSRLIRFRSTDGRILRGEPQLPEDGFDLGSLGANSGTPLKARVIVDDDIFDTTGATTLSEEVVEVQQILGPLTRTDVPSVRCVGLNFKAHSKFLTISFSSGQEQPGSYSFPACH